MKAPAEWWRTLNDKELVALWTDLEPNKRARALAIARIVSNRGTDELKAKYAAKIKDETFPCDERDEALHILAPNTGLILAYADCPDICS